MSIRGIVWPVEEVTGTVGIGGSDLGVLDLAGIAFREIFCTWSVGLSVIARRSGLRMTRRVI